MGWTLAKMGHEVHFSASHYAPTHSFNLYETANLWNSIGSDGNVEWTQLAKSIHAYSKMVDVIIYSNEPNWPFKIIKENTDLPVIFDIHDWTSLGCHRFSEEVDMEKWAIEHADGFIVASRGYLRRIREVSRKPSTLIYAKVTQHLYPNASQDKSLPGLCYDGGVKGVPNGLEYNYPYRNWASFAKSALPSMKMEDSIYFYTANTGEDFQEYADDRIKISEPLMYNVLLESMGRHTAGLVGSPYPILDFEDSMPNKLFEYTAAGIPCIVVNAPEAKRYVEEHGLGIGIADPSEVGEALSRLSGHHVARDRWEHTMEGEMPKLLELLNEVTCKRVRHIPQVGGQKTG